ncbi:hypothetical protein BJ875DRAFT_508267 [Amylocarpus encephaloides]|uniref:Uncharacterized protein n=1 Tax=Amylocarpus encephaloides TaxID=45428 RepID=A0A9P7Y830_9HELO|nr:hypothetical protein BJ875DRAFT_508267 [Amylocarpus encephaloides]
MSTNSSSNINPLHRQRVKGREIIVTEEPRLHLVWFHDRIYIKPLPKYLLSHRFWEIYLVNQSTCLGDRQDAIRKAALGYLRSYRYLIRHESDFTIAKQDQLRLIPHDVGWAAFCQFISASDQIKDVDFHFEQIHVQYGDYFARFYGPILFIFAIVSTILDSMQVELAVDQNDSADWISLWPVFRYFSAIVLIGAVLVSFCFIVLWLWLFLDEWIYTTRFRRQKKRSFSTANCKQKIS